MCSRTGLQGFWTGTVAIRDTATVRERREKGLFFLILECKTGGDRMWCLLLHIQQTLDSRGEKGRMEGAW